MQLKAILVTVFLAATGVKAALNEPCYGAGGAPGTLDTLTVPIILNSLTDSRRLREDIDLLSFRWHDQQWRLSS